VAFKLSRAAVDDLLDIYFVGVERFGVKQAEEYQDGFDSAFAFLADFRVQRVNGPSCSESLAPILIDRI